MYFRDKLWRWIDSDLRKNEINSSYFERKWFSKNENDTRVEIFRGTITDIRTDGWDSPTFSESETRAVLNLLDIPGDPCESMVNDVLALTFNKRIQNIPKHYYNYVACQKPINVSYTNSENRVTDNVMGTVAKLKFNNLESYTLVCWSSSLRSSSCYCSQCMLPAACQKKDR